MKNNMLASTLLSVIDTADLREQLILKIRFNWESHTFSENKPPLCLVFPYFQVFQLLQLDFFTESGWEEGTELLTQEDYKQDHIPFPLCNAHNFCNKNLPTRILQD